MTIDLSLVSTLFAVVFALSAGAVGVVYAVKAGIDAE